MNRTDFDHTKLDGPDTDIDTSLKEYGIAWIEQDGELLVYYGIGYSDGEYSAFDFATFDADIDVFKEYDWIDWPGVFLTMGMSKDEWDSQLSFGQKLHDLMNYYGCENIFGSSYWDGLSYEDIVS